MQQLWYMPLFSWHMPLLRLRGTWIVGICTFVPVKQWVNWVTECGAPLSGSILCLQFREHTSVWVSIRQHRKYLGGDDERGGVIPCPKISIRPYTSAYVSIRPHTSAYVSTRQLIKSSVVRFFARRSTCTELTTTRSFGSFRRRPHALLDRFVVFRHETRHNDLMS
jgi:hypothetical protein